MIGGDKYVSYGAEQQAFHLMTNKLSGAEQQSYFHVFVAVRQRIKHAGDRSNQWKWFYLSVDRRPPPPQPRASLRTYTIDMKGCCWFV